MAIRTTFSTSPLDLSNRALAGGPATVALPASSWKVIGKTIAIAENPIYLSESPTTTSSNGSEKIIVFLYGHVRVLPLEEQAGSRLTCRKTRCVLRA